MPTDSPRTGSRPLSNARFLVTFVSGAIAVGIVAAVFALRDEPDTALGALSGGAVMLLLLLVARWRTVRRPARAGTAARVGAGAADERDQAILTGALSLVGATSFGYVAAASTCVILGLDARAVLSLTFLALLVTIVVALVVGIRRS